MASAALARAGQWGVEGWLGWWDVSEKGKNIVPKMDFKCAHVGEHRGAIKGDRKEREREGGKAESESKESERLLKCAVDGADGSVNSNKAHIPRRRS